MVTGIVKPDWRSSKTAATRIIRADDRLMGIAGIWPGNSKVCPGVVRRFTMPTVNADEHKLMRNYHRPEDEKRMVVIFPEAQYGEWLDASPLQALEFLQQYPAAWLVASKKVKWPREVGEF